jgi:hypothetical protein
MSASLFCMAASAGLTTAQEPEPLAHVYFPLQIGYRWTYREVDLKAPAGQIAKQAREVTIEVERKEVYAHKTKDKENKDVTKDYMGFILKMTSAGKTTQDHVVVLQEGVYRVHIDKTPINPPLLFFKFNTPDPWTLDSVSGGKNLKGTFVGKADKVSVPFGKDLSAWLVSFHNNKQGDERGEVDVWFAENVGMVKQRIKSKSQEIQLELLRFEKGK